MFFIFLVCFAGIPAFMLIKTLLQPSDRGYAKIEFKTFKNFYNINPDRWKLHDEYVCCATKIKYGMTWEDEKFQFNFSDYQKYKKWLKNKHKRDKEIRHMKSTAKMIAAVKQDIAKCEKTADQQINQAKSILETLFEV